MGESMDKYQSAFLIIAMCGIVFLILAIKTNSHIILNFILRSVSGCFIIGGINYLLESKEILLSVGLNPITFLTTGILGFPGVILLFGIKIYTLL